MKYLKLFESFSNVEKVTSANNIFEAFRLVLDLRELNLKNIQIDISSSEHFIFYYAKNNAGEKLFGFVKHNSTGKVGYFSTDFIDYLRYFATYRITGRYRDINMSSLFTAFKIYFNIDKLEITNTLFIRKKYDRYIDLYEHEPPISKGGLTQKLIEWLDSGKETSKEEFFRSSRFIKTADVNKPFFELPKGYYYGYLSDKLARARRDGLIDFVRRGKNTIMVKGKNFDEIKAKKAYEIS